MSKQLKKKLAIMIVVEMIFLFLLGSFLLSMQTSLSVENQKSSNTEILNQLATLLENREETADQTYASFDEIYQSKAMSVSFMARKVKDFSYTTAKMRELRSLLQVENVIILDAEGQVVASAEQTVNDYSASRYNQLRTVFQGTDPSEAFNVTIGEQRLRYYGSRIDANTMAVVVQDPQELYETLDNTSSIASVFDGVSVGLSGYAFAVSHKDYSFLYYPEEHLIGMDAVNAGLDASQLSDGYSGWVTVDGKEMYCSTKVVGDVYAVSAVPKDEINASRLSTVSITLLIFFVVINLVIAYGIFLKEEENSSRKINEKAYKKICGFYINTEIVSKISSIGLFGLVAIFIVSVFMQTLFSLSRQTMSNQEPLLKIEETNTANNQEVVVLTDQYNERYLNKCQVLADILKKNPELINERDLAELSEILDLINIWIFDENGKTIATDSTYWDFVLSDDPEEQSYAFHSLANGYVDHLIQDARPDEVTGELRQYIGVTMKNGAEHKAGFAQICIAPEKMEQVLANTTVESVLSGVQVGSGGFAFGVNLTDKTFSYYPDEKLTGKSVYDYGFSDFDLHDDFSDFINIQSEKYYCSSKQMGDYLIYVAVPSREMNRFCIPVAIYTVIGSLLCLLIAGVILVTTRKIPSPDENGEIDDNASVIDVKMPDGRIRKTTAAANRWGLKPGIDWDEKTPEQRLLSLLNFFLTGVALILVVMIIFKDQFFGAESIMHYVFSGRWEKSLNVFAVTNAIMLFILANVVAVLVRRMLMMTAKIFGARGETVCRLLDSVIKYMTILCLLYYCLGMFGVDTKTLLASAGIMSVIIGLGSKELISDILAGLFIVFEGEFRVGDIVTVGDWRGTVLEIGVRTTKIEDPSKNIKIISNSNVTGVINMTKQFSYASCDVGIEYGESLERVERILQDELPRIRQRLKSIVDGPFYKGVVSLGDNSVNIRLTAQCTESDRAQLIRDLNREVKLIFDKHNINIPFPQIVLNQPTVFEQATIMDKIQSAAFVEEQKEASKGLEEFEQNQS